MMRRRRRPRCRRIRGSGTGSKRRRRMGQIGLPGGTHWRQYAVGRTSPVRGTASGGGGKDELSDEEAPDQTTTNSPPSLHRRGAPSSMCRPFHPSGYFGGQIEQLEKSWYMLWFLHA